jgi:hypothetical protein
MVMVTAANSHGAPAYGTKMPEQGEFHLGGQLYFVNERKLEGMNGEMNSRQQFMLISYGLLDWLSIDLKGGAGNINQIPDSGDSIDYKSYVGGGYGFRMRLIERDKFRAVWGFQHISIHPFSADAGGNKHKAVLDDWQLSFLASYDIGKITPYGGFRWSRMDYIYWKNGDRNRVKSDLDRSYGLIVGADWNISKNTWLNVEGNFFDAQAVAVGINFKF